jgi:hypothetical protein
MAEPDAFGPGRYSYSTRFIDNDADGLTGLLLFECRRVNDALIFFEDKRNRSMGVPVFQGEAGEVAFGGI